MKKEYFLVAIIALYILSSALDYLAGPLRPLLKNPFDFFKPAVISIYPFTTVSIAIKTIILLTSILLGFSFIERKYLAKGIFLLFLTALFELYSIQQIATGSRIVSLEWLLALAFTGIVLFLPSVFFMIIGIMKLIHQKLTRVVDPYSEIEKVE